MYISISISIEFDIHVYVYVYIYIYIYLFYTYISISIPISFAGIFYSMGVLGPAIGYIGGGFLLDLYVDVGRVDMESYVQ